MPGLYNCGFVLRSGVELFPHTGLFCWVAGGGLSQAPTVVVLCYVVVLCSFRGILFKTGLLEVACSLPLIDPLPGDNQDLDKIGAGWPGLIYIKPHSPHLKNDMFTN